MSIDGLWIMGIGTAVLTGVLSFLAYKLGSAQEKIKNEEEKSETAVYLRSLRRRLDDPDVVKRLHDAFKR